MVLNEHNSDTEVFHAGLLCEVPVSAGDEEYSINHHEERPSSDPGFVPCLQDKDVQDWQGIA